MSDKHNAQTRQHVPLDYAALTTEIKAWGRELGFQHIGISDIDLGDAEAHLFRWLKKGYHGHMHYMQRHGIRRSRPAELLKDTLRVISARMNYWPETAADAFSVLEQANKGYISRYAVGRDYHKVLRRRLQKLAGRINARVGTFTYRVFTDSAPVLEKALAEKAGLGWIGKHTNLIHQQSGSWFFLGEIYTDLPLLIDTPGKNHCGDCHNCLDICPTRAIVAPYELDARRCISYLTIELRGSIPEALRGPIGNRIYGCDDCQLICPWNRFAKPSNEPDFLPRSDLDAPALTALFTWSKEKFLKKTEGSAIRRIGHECWLRNIAVALGNAPTSETVIKVLAGRREHPSALVREHVDWALKRHDAQK